MTQPEGATPTATSPTATAAESGTQNTETPGAEALGDPGKRALDAMKAERNAAKAAEAAALARVKELEDRDKSDAEKAAEAKTVAEKVAADATSRVMRLEVAFDKGLTPKQAARLVGSTREELEADADELLATFANATRTPGLPAPDPSQGAKGGAATPDLDSQIREAQSKGDYRTVIRLQNQKFANVPN